MSAVLNLESVYKSYDKRSVINNLSLHLDEGKILALLGPNGAGKTTTVDICTGFNTPDSGSVEVLGYNPVTEAEKLRPHIGIMLQSGGSYPGVKTAEMLHLCASYSKNPLDPEWLLDLVGLRSQARTNYRRLSGGQQQRLSLACALVGRPSLLFLDEPTAGLDAQSRIAVWDIIHALRRDGASVVLTTHLMDEAESLADYVTIIDHGTAVAQGTTAELTSGAEPRMSISTNKDYDPRQWEKALQVAGLTVNIRLIKPRHYSLQGTINPDVLAIITNKAAQDGVLITDLSLNHHSLEDIFLDITGREIRS